MSNIFQLIYSSKRSETCDELAIQRILSISLQNNPHVNVTGLLLVAGMLFIQCLEGEEANVLDLYKKIKEDERHFNCTIVCIRKVEERIFPAWSMAFKDITKEAALDFYGEISAEEVALFQEILAGQKVESTFATRLLLRLLNNNEKLHKFLE